MSVDTRSDLNYRIADIHGHDIDPYERIIYLTGVEDHPDEDFNDPGVEYRQSNRFIKNINIMTSLNEHKPVLVVLKSPGGDCDEGMAIYDAILAAPMPITVVGYSCVASMASIILQAANKRVMMPSSSFMFHMGFIGAAGTPKQVDSTVNYDSLFRDKMIDIYVDVMKTAPHGKTRNWSKKRIREWLNEQMDKKEDVYLTSDQTVEWGFADEVFEGRDAMLDYTSEELLRK